MGGRRLLALLSLGVSPMGAHTTTAFSMTAVAPSRAPRTPGGATGTAPPSLKVEHHSPPGGYPSLGAPGARTTLVFYIDFQCSVCPRADRELPQLVMDLGGALRIEIRHNPLPIHPQAMDAAVASKAAQNQGRFWEYHDLLLLAGRYDRETLLSLAAGIKLDPQAFARDLDDPDLRRAVQSEAEEARRLGAAGTPAFLINHHVEVGWASLAWLEEVVRREMATAGRVKSTPGSP